MSSTTTILEDADVVPDEGAKSHPGYHALAAVFMLLCAIAPYHLLEKRRTSHNWIAHLAFVGVSAAVIVLLPFRYSNYLFSAMTESVVGVAVPIYESVRAICTPEESDDKAWLQYWIAGGVFFMFSTWVDDAIRSDTRTEYWYECTTFAFYWLYFPLTNGADLLFEYVTKPYIVPRVRPLATKMDSMVEFIIQTLVNASHLAFLWIIFVFLPKGLKRIVTVAVGTVYPLVSSISAASTHDVDDDSYWLTYWACYGVLFLLMDILESWMGWIPGFYSLVIFSTIYLMLPMFQGADKVFRKILVPLAGLDEMLMLRDAIGVKRAMLKTLNPERAKKVSKAISKFYDDDLVDGSADPEVLKQELLEGWSGLKLPKLKNPFKSSGGATTSDSATETTPLV